MKNLTGLVKQFKKSKEEKILNEIFINLKNKIEDKAKFVFYKQNFFGKKNDLKLCQLKQETLFDVIQDLNLLVLKLIQRYNTKKPFENYLNYSLKLYRPSFINADFMKNLKTQSIYYTNNEGEEENIAEEKPIIESKKIEFNEPLTEREREVFDLFKNNLNITQEEIAKELGLSQQSISLVIASIKNKVIK